MRPTWVLGLGLSLLLGALVPGCTAGYCSPGHPCWPLNDELHAFRDTLSNVSSVLIPGEDPDFLIQATPMQLLMSSAIPGLIVLPGSEEDLARTLAFAAERKIRVVVKCSGHDFNARSTGYGTLQVNMQRFNSLEFDADNNTVTIGAGVDGGAVYKAAAARKRAVVGGHAHTVCLAGCTMGGCHGMLSRKHGLGLDNVLAMRVMLYNGTVVTASNSSSHASLFHALLGSGHSTYGVVTAITLRAYPAPTYVTAVSSSWVMPKSLRGPNLLSTYLMNATWWKALAPTFGIYVDVSPGYVSLQVVFSGDRYKDLEVMYTALAKMPGFTYQTLTGKNYSSIYEYALENYDSYVWSSKFVANVLVPPDQATLNLIADHIVRTQGKDTMQLIYMYGGEAAKGTQGSVSPGMRSAMLELVIGGLWESATEDHEGMAGVSEAAKMLYAMSPNSYVNEYTSWFGLYNNISDWRTRFYSNYSSLLEVKRAYDPCNLFTVEYGVGSDQPTATCGPDPAAAADAAA